MVGYRGYLLGFRVPSNYFFRVLTFAFRILFEPYQRTSECKFSTKNPYQQYHVCGIFKLLLIMRIVPLALSVLITAGLVFCLNTPFGQVPPLGKFLSPQHGFWQNADALDKDFNARLDLPELKDRPGSISTIGSCPIFSPAMNRTPVLYRAISTQNSVSGKWNSRCSPRRGD